MLIEDLSGNRLNELHGKKWEKVNILELEADQLSEYRREFGLYYERSEKGMPKFDHAMDAEGAQAVRAYVIDTAKNTIGLCESELRVQYPELLNPACQMAVATTSESAGE